MALYKIDKQRLEYIRDVKFKCENEIKKLTEENLLTLLGLDFIKSEFVLKNRRFDTLAFNNETKAFVIIEYKNDNNRELYSVIDQGYTYLALMLDNKAEVILTYSEVTGKTLKRTDVDWSQSRVLFVAPSFTDFQREAINFRDLPIELWEVKRFENNTLSFERVRKTTAKESIKTISKAGDTVDAVSKELVVFTEQDHLQRADPDIQELYQHLKGRLLNLDDDITVQPQKLYVAFKINKTNICDVELQKRALKITVNLKSGELQDSLKVVRDISNVGHWGNGDYEIKMGDAENIDYIISIVKQSLDKNRL